MKSEQEKWTHRFADAAARCRRWGAALPRPVASVASSLALLLVYIMLGQASYLFVFPPSPSAIVWLPSGLNVALFARARRALWLWPGWLAALAVGESLLVLYHGLPWTVAIAWGVANALAPLTGVLLIGRLLPEPFALRQVREVLMFALIAVVAVVPGTLVAAFAAARWLNGQSFAPMILSWASSDALGVLLTAPVLLTLATMPRRLAGRFGESLALFLGLPAALMLVRYAHPMKFDWSLPTIFLTFTTWAAIRFGPWATSLITLVLDLIIMGVTARGAGPFATAQMTPGERLLALQILAANFGLLSLLLAAALEEQRAARAAAEAATRARDEFLSVASHELRTPLTALQFSAQLLLSGKDSSAEAKQRCIDLIQRQVQKLALLTGELLDTTRIREGRLALTLEEVDLQPLVREVAERMASLIGQSGSTLTVRAEVPICGRWDRMRFEQILINLLSNAAKFGTGKPIELEAELEAFDLARIRVTDHGVGIVPERLERIFDCFAHDVDRHYGGLGLGLYVVRSLAQRLGGSVTVASELGVGSSFTVRLPLSGPRS